MEEEDKPVQGTEEKLWGRCMSVSLSPSVSQGQERAFLMLQFLLPTLNSSFLQNPVCQVPLGSDTPAAPQAQAAGGISFSVDWTPRPPF